MKFVYLNNKSGYSLLKSTLKIKDLVKIAKDKNFEFLALTDSNNMFGAMEFVDECKENNIKPIIGMEVSIDIYEIPLILIATSNEGYLNLCHLTRIVSKQDLNTTVSFEDLNQYKNGLIAILPYIRGNLYEMDKERLDKLVNNLKSIYTGFYLGLEYYGESTRSLLESSRKFASYNNLSTVPVFEVLTDKMSNTYLIDVLRAIDLKTTIDLLDYKNYENHYFLSDLIINSIFSEEEMYSSNKIASIIEYDFDKIKGDLVKYPLDENVDLSSYLRSLATKGIYKRLDNHVSKQYLDRLDYELNIIKKMNYENYFLVVYDYVKFAKTHNILVGPGRGSSGSCLVAYSLGITNVDPLKYNLLFERFLNPERVSMPDIDVDFIDTKREEVFDYLTMKYGNERVCRVITFSTLTTKAILRDVSRVMGCSVSEINDLTKKLSDIKDGGLEEVALASPSFMSLVKTNDKYNKIYNTSLLLEGLPRQTSTHAAGVIISNERLFNTIPVYSPIEDNYVTQFDLKYLERFNLYKMDLLGLTNLSFIQECIDKILEYTGKNLNVYNIDLDDPNIYKIFNKGYYSGIFQFDQNAIKMASNQIKPTNFMDIVVANSLGRKASQQFIPNYVRRKKNLERFSYIHPCLEPILKETYGIIIYQEQVMQVLTALSTFSLGKADIVRRAISKKDISKLSPLKNEFISGCKKNNISEKDAVNVWNNIEKFAEYGFPKSHSVEYSMIASQEAYIKYYYPAIFYSSLFNCIFEESKFSTIVLEMKKLGIKLLPPSINESYGDFRASGKDCVRFALSKIKEIAPSVIEIIIKERENGKYCSFVDFVKRTFIKGIKKESYVALIEANCFEEFNYNRTTLLNNLDTVIMYASIVAKEDNGVTIFDSSILEPQIREYEDNILELNDKEKERLGVYLSSFPLEKDREKIKQAGFVTIEELKENKIYKLVVKINNVKTIKTKKGDKMAFVDCEDESGSISITVFSDLFSVHEDILKKDNFIQVRGRVEERNDSLSLVADLLKIYKIKE